jgi:hypothetical protein
VPKVYFSDRIVATHSRKMDNPFIMLDKEITIYLGGNAMQLWVVVQFADRPEEPFRNRAVQLKSCCTYENRP